MDSSKKRMSGDHTVTCFQMFNSVKVIARFWTLICLIEDIVVITYGSVVI